MSSEHGHKSKEAGTAGGGGGGPAEGGRRPTGAGPGSDRETGPRWTASRKMEVVLRILRGESLDKVSRETGVPTHKLAKWQERALNAVECGLKDRDMDPLQAEYREAMRRIGELSMENELLRERARRASLPLALRRSK